MKSEEEIEGKVAGYLKPFWVIKTFHRYELEVGHTHAHTQAPGGGKFRRLGKECTKNSSIMYVTHMARADATHTPYKQWIGFHNVEG